MSSRQWAVGSELVVGGEAELFWMVTLGFIGFMVASSARNTIDESVRQRIEEEINAAQNPVPAATTY